MQQRSMPPNGARPPQGPPSKYQFHDQCEGPLTSFIDELSTTLYNTDESAAHYPAAPTTAGNTTSNPNPSAKKATISDKVEELDDAGNAKEASKKDEAAEKSKDAAAVPIIKKIEIPQIDAGKVLETLLAARPDVFEKIQQHMKTTIRHLYVSDEDANIIKAEGNKSFMAYQDEVSSWGNKCSPPTVEQQVAAQKNWEMAFSSYTHAISKAKTDACLATLLNNRSTTIFAVKQYRDAALDCNYCLKLQPTYWKALQRRGMCMAKLGYAAVGDADVAFAEKMINATAAATTEDAKEALGAEASAYDYRFDLHDALLHSFQNVSNYADEEEAEAAAAAAAKKAKEEGEDGDNAANADADSHKRPKTRILTAAHRLSAPPTILKLSRDEVTVDRDAKRGRFIAAKKVLPAGHSVLVETPYAHASYIGAMGKACSFCLRPTRMLYPCDKYRASGARCRGLFCSSECARLNWELYGERESKNVYFNVCPIDALLASRVVFREFKQSAVLIPSADNADADEKGDKNSEEDAERKEEEEELRRLVLLTLAKTAEERAHVAIDSVGDNKWGKDHMDALVQYTSELFPQLADAGGRETVITALTQFFAVFREERGLDKNIQQKIVEKALADAAAKKGDEPLTAEEEEHIRKTCLEGKAVVDSRPPTAEEKAKTEKFRKVLRQIPVNAFPILFRDRIYQGGETHNVAQVPLGKALYAVGSLFNHSCNPNCVATFAGNPFAASAQLTIRTVRPVQEGEELTIAYSTSNTPNIVRIDKFHIHSNRARIRELRSRFGFACNCPACTKDVDEVINKEEEQYYIKASDYYQKGRRLMREGNFKESVNVLMQSYEIVMRYICPPPRPPQWMLVNTHEALAQSYNCQGDKKKAVEHLKAALSLVIQLYDRHASQIAANMGPLALEGGDHAEEERKAAEATDTAAPASSSTTNTEDAGKAPQHPHNHQPAKASPIVPGTPSPLALSASFLCSDQVSVHANEDIISSFIRLANMCRGAGKEEELKRHDGGASADEGKKFISNYTKDAKRFAARAAALMKIFYGESASLDAELLELELIIRQ